MEPWWEALSEPDREIARQALTAASEGPFFPDWEFETLMGVTRAEMRAAEVSFTAVTNALLNLWGYPHGASEKTWAQYLSVSPDELKRVLHQLRTA